jgi:hypothetical protein
LGHRYREVFRQRRYSLGATGWGATAVLEDALQWVGLRAGKQPAVTFYAEVRLRRVLDLTSPDTLRALKLSVPNLHRPWRGAARLTATQSLGKAICEHSYICAIRYPSLAATAAGQSGNNVVIYRNHVKKPDSVRILGPTRKPLGKWP